MAFAEQGYALLIEKPLAHHRGGVPRRSPRRPSAPASIAAVAHVLRYTPYTRLRAGAARRAARSARSSASSTSSRSASCTRRTPTCAATGAARTRPAPMLLAKCCHDLDWLSLPGRAPLRSPVSSFGSLAHFRPEHRPDGAADRCLDCAIEPGCAYSAAQALPRAGRARRDAAGRSTSSPGRRRPSNVEAALRDGPYGRCVWACDNDVVDHQVVSLRLRGRRDREPHDDRVHQHARPRDADLRHRAASCAATASRRRLRLPHARRRRATRSPATGRSTGHGGGDDGVMADFVAAVDGRRPGARPDDAARTRWSRTGSRSRPRPRAARAATVQLGL